MDRSTVCRPGRLSPEDDSRLRTTESQQREMWQLTLKQLLCLSDAYASKTYGRLVDLCIILSVILCNCNSIF